MEPKVDSGPRFLDFWETLISCDSTMVLHDFHGLGLPQGVQKSIKTWSEKTLPKQIEKNTFFTKIVENVLFLEYWVRGVGPLFWHLFSPWAQK